MSYLRITFEGAIETVTGSCTLLKAADKNILVDCGLYEGVTNECMNSRNLIFDPKKIDYILLTHAHIDHSGRIPYLVKKGFRGKVLCTKPTLDLCEIMLIDSGYIQQKMQKWDMKPSKKKELVLYDMEDAKRSLQYFVGAQYDEEIEIDENIKVKFTNSGHMLGSAYIEVYVKEQSEQTKIVFTGDLGNPTNNMLNGIKSLESADVLVMESTYGDRLHDKTETIEEQIRKAIIQVADRGGKLIIPSFAVGRTQEIIVYLKKVYKKLEDRYRIPVYADSPLAIEAYDRFLSNKQYLKPYITNELVFDELKLVQELSESQYISTKDESMVIVSASGMADFGRIKEHIKNNVSNENNMILFSGYLAEGTFGRELKKERRNIKIGNEKYKVRAKIKTLQGISGHLDMDGLLEFVSDMKKQPDKIFLNHGSQDAKENLKNELKNITKADIVIPKRDEENELKGKKETKRKRDIKTYTVQEKILYSLYGNKIYDHTLFQKDSTSIEAIDNQKQLENLRKLGYEV